MHFIGDNFDEQGVDTGGLTREFLRLVGLEVISTYCTGEPGQCLFTKNVSALQAGAYTAL